jgi:uncharacterized protein YggE
MKIRFPRTALALAFALSSAAAALAQDRPEPRLITVTGEAEVLVVPDEVVFDLTVQNLSKELRVAKAQTDERLKKLIDLTRRYGVAAADVQTDYVRVEPRYRGNDESRLFLGYAVRKDLIFTLRDVSKAEALLSEVIESGVTRINGINFRTSELRKHRDRARVQAIRAAREKAVALTAEIGQRVGKAYSIIEDVPTGRAYLQNIQSNAVVMGEGESSESSGTLALGQIRVNARVTVRFELE